MRRKRSLRDHASWRSQGTSSLSHHLRPRLPRPKSNHSSAQSRLGPTPSATLNYCFLPRQAKDKSTCPFLSRVAHLVNDCLETRYAPEQRRGRCECPSGHGVITASMRPPDEAPALTICWPSRGLAWAATLQSSANALNAAVICRSTWAASSTCASSSASCASSSGAGSSELTCSTMLSRK